ncbi:MAG: regulatory protein TetR [Frondihabitans sp.]|nr:regulatory protein TetR [Frondihabitans sp.]
MAGETRSRMVDAAVVSLQRDGLAGMSFTDVLAASGAARGAIYHHFPGGKNELAAEATRRNGDQVRAALAALPDGSPSDVVDAFLVAIRPVLAVSAAGGGCAVAAVTVGVSGTNHELLDIAHDTFDTWESVLADRLNTAGLGRSDAQDLATTLLALLEGAHVLCRAAGSLEPLDRVVRSAARLGSGLGGARPHGEGV